MLAELPWTEVELFSVMRRSTNTISNNVRRQLAKTWRQVGELHTEYEAL
jgi:hypothetical protein